MHLEEWEVRVPSREGSGFTPKAERRCPSVELVPCGGSTYYIPGSTNVGVVVREGRAVLIDSGNDESRGRKILQLLEQQGWGLDLIAQTHSHADHTGGNALLQRRTGCRIAATHREAPLIDDPSLEPLFLWGAEPFRELRTKFLQASPSRVTDRFRAGEPVGEGLLRSFPLPGHFLDMAGFISPDGVAFVGDSVFSEEILEKHGFAACCDVEGQLKTLQFLEGLEADFFVPSHATPGKDIKELVRRNRGHTERLSEEIALLCATPRSREEVLEALAKAYNVAINPVSYVLSHLTVAAHLSWLAHQGVLRPRGEGGRLIWERTA